MTKLQPTKQGLVKQFNAGKMVFTGKDVVAHAEIKVMSDISKELTVIPMSENRLFRKFGGDQFSISTSGKKVYDWTNFAVVSGDEAEMAPLLLETIMDQGFMHDGKRYKCIMRSASGMRLAKALFTTIPQLWDSLDDVTFGAQFVGKDGKVQMSKVRTREGLALTNTREIADVSFTHGVIDDFTRGIEIDSLQLVDGRMQPVKVVTELMPTDGMGFITYAKACEIASSLGLNYVPSAFQIRFAGAKGLLVVYKWDRTAKPEWDKDVLFLDSMWKYDFDTARYNKKNGNQPNMEIASWVKPPKSEYVNLTYQFIQALDVKAEDLISLAQESLTKIETGVLSDPAKTMLFLGMLETTGDDSYEDKLVSNLTRILDADPAMLHDAYVQKKLRMMLERFIMDMRRGKVPVAGFYRYIIADPTVIFGNDNGVLDAGEFYHNNEVNTYAGFRSPLVHSSEAVRMNMVEVDEFQMTETHKRFGEFTYLQDLIVLNTYDDTLPRMGGADVDGDRIMITDRDFIVNAVKGGTLIYDEGKEGISVEYNRRAVYEFDMATMKKSRIGIITDYGTIWSDLMHHVGKDKYDVNVQILRVLQGQEIDSVKTGYVPEIPEAIMLKMAPHWLEKNINKKTRKAKPLSKQIKQYESTSAMGKLYDFVINYWAEFQDVNPSQCKKRSLEIIRKIDKEEATTIYKYVERLEHAYRVELGILREYQLENNLDPEDDKIQALREEIFARYTALMQDIDADPRTVAGVAYNITYGRNDAKGKSLSFPWITATDGLLLLLAEISQEESNRYKLVPVRGELVIPGKMKFSSKESKNSQGKVIARATVPNGTYDVVELEGRCFAKVKRTARPKVELKSPTAQKMVHFNIRGFKHNGLTASSAHKLLVESNGVVDLIKQGEYIAVIANNTQIGVVGGDDDFTAVTLIGKRAQIQNVDAIQLTFKSNRDGKIRPVGQFDIVAQLTGEEVEFEELEAGQTVDLKANFQSRFESYGFDDVQVNVIENGIGEIGTLKVTHAGNVYNYTVNIDVEGEIFFTGLRIKSEDIRNTLARYVIETMRTQHTA